MLAIVDYKVCNISSVLNMARKVGAPGQPVSTAAGIEAASKIILPGIGNFGEGMRALAELKLIESLRTAVLSHRKPILGICLGMQLMGVHSEEGDCAGLGLVRAQTQRFSPGRMSERLPIPHMGWREVRRARDSVLLSDLPKPARFYFAHSHHVILQDNDQALLWADYGYPFVAAYQTDNMIGVQFHPEKSHVLGERFIKNFVEQKFAD